MSNADVWAAGVSRGGVCGVAARPFDDLRTSHLIDVETHQAVFAWMLQRLADAGLVKAKIVGIDATAVEGERLLSLCKIAARRGCLLAGAAGLVTPAFDLDTDVWMGARGTTVSLRVNRRANANSRDEGWTGHPAWKQWSKKLAAATGARVPRRRISRP
jgi:hypothetical protein